MFGMLRDQEARQSMDCGEPRIACGNAVVPFSLKERQEPPDQIGAEVCNFQCFDRPPAVLRSKLQKQHQGRRGSCGWC